MALSVAYSVHATFIKGYSHLPFISPMMLPSFLFTAEKIFTVITPKNPHKDRLYAGALIVF